MTFASNPAGLAVAVALALATVACGAPAPPRPDHGTYVATGAEQPPGQRFEFPRTKRLVIKSPSARFLCARELAQHELQGKGIAVATTPVEPGGALELSIAIESLDGPGGSWNPLSGAITSSHQRTDISLVISEPGSATAIWRTHTRLRTNLSCADQELRTQLRFLLDAIG